MTARVQQPWELVRQFARLRHREQVSNRNECHRNTSSLVLENGLIGIEDLAIGT